jgi:hypothetical protein
LFALITGTVVFTVAAVVLGATVLTHLNVDHSGAVYMLANVKLVPLVTIYVPLLAIS